MRCFNHKWTNIQWISASVFMEQTQELTLYILYFLSICLIFDLLQYSALSDIFSLTHISYWGLYLSLLQIQL